MSQPTPPEPLSSSPDPNKPRLDHIIILLPYADLLKPPDWLTTRFTITPGGRHADNKTENKLIVFHDGSYIELIAFINDDPERREGHWWGDKKPGIIDVAFTTLGDARSHWEGVQERLVKLEMRSGKGYGYAEPVAGGRKREDGEEVKWEVTFPKGVRRGELPFFCHDVTLRKFRVPLSKENCTHPCQAYGIKSISVKVPDAKAAELAKVYEAVFGGRNTADAADHGIFQLYRVLPAPEIKAPKLCVRRPGDDKKTRELVEEYGVVLGDMVVEGFSPISYGDIQEDYGIIFLHHDQPLRWALGAGGI